ncbi:unnamed protein product [Calicophoron daubneyi]|uniref:cAMP-responsive element-binding protein-like 2 n=1 Tax=Calicophoron daubneyi TaxID=300641 RepID=A0AAV2T1A5_CALDB
MKRPISAAVTPGNIGPTGTSTVNSRSSESAKDCRKRKTLRIQYLAESVRLRELTVLKMKRDIDKLLEICRQLDEGQWPEDLVNEVDINADMEWSENAKPFG